MLYAETQMARLEKGLENQLSGTCIHKVILEIKDIEILNTYFNNYSPDLSAYQIAEKTKDLEHPVSSAIVVVLNRRRKLFLRRKLEVRYVKKGARKPLSLFA